MTTWTLDSFDNQHLRFRMPTPVNVAGFGNKLFPVVEIEWFITDDHPAGPYVVEQKTTFRLCADPDDNATEVWSDITYTTDAVPFNTTVEALAHLGQTAEHKRQIPPDWDGQSIDASGWCIPARIEYLVRAMTQADLKTAAAEHTSVCFEDESCGKPSAFVIGQRAIANDPDPMTCVRLACGNHARMFTLLHGLVLPSPAASSDIGDPPIRKSPDWHDGYALRRLPSGQLIDPSSAPGTTEFNAYLAACGCGWIGSTAHPPTAAGLATTENQWRREHLYPKTDQVASLGTVMGYYQSSFGHPRPWRPSDEPSTPARAT